MPPLNKQTHAEDELQFINNIGFRIQFLRKKKWLSQAELAEKAGLSVNTICNLEGPTPFGLSLITIFRIAKALDVEPSQLFDFK